MAILLGACHQPTPTPPPAPPPRAEAKPHAWPDPDLASEQGTAELTGPTNPAAAAAAVTTAEAAAAVAAAATPATATAATAGAPTPSTEPEPAAAPPDPAGTPTQRRIDATPPPAPKDLVAEATSERAIALRWSAPRDDAGVVGYQVLRDEAVVATVKTVRAGEEGLRPGTSYCYTLRALDAARKVSATAGPVCATTPDHTPPLAPAQLAAVAVSETEVKLQWTAATDEVGVAGYEVLRAGHVVAGGPSLAAHEKGLRPYTEYCYAVRAFDAAGNRSGPSPDACVRTLDTTPPSAPQHVVASATSDRTVQVLWQASTDNVGVARYELRRADGVVAAPAVAWAEDRDLAPAHRYCYTVQAVDLAGNRSAPSAAACAVTPDLTPPTPPSAVAAQPVSSSSVFLVWQPSVDDVAVTGYELLSDGELTATVAGAEAKAAVPNGKHCFRVRAFDGAGNRSALSDATCAVTADPSQPAAPFRLRAEPASEKAVQLSWQPSSVPGVVYRVYWEGGKSIGATRSTGFSAIGLKPGERHCYRVGAIDDSGHESPRTLEACAAPRGEALTVRE